MAMAARSLHFRDNVKRALADRNLKTGLDRTTGLLRSRRAEAYRNLENFEALREAGMRIKDHTLDNLDLYLDQFIRHAEAAGCIVHIASGKEEACRITVDICTQAGAKTVTRAKSMLGEEIGLPHALEAAGIERVETDLAEHINQLAGDEPAHIVVPALHKTHEQVRELFKAHHASPTALDEIPSMVESARIELRQKFASADVGISGANFLIAESGTVCTVTNEGNAELTTEMPKVHIVTAGIEKLVPTFEHTTILLRLLARSALGTEFTQYTSFFTGPRREGDLDGPEAMHIVLVDNRRTDMLAGPYRDMLRCIRCGACMNHCPVYARIGGHAYGSIYPGPMGAILTPHLVTIQQAPDLPHACTMNGSCEEVCPVKIPLTGMIRELRAQTWAQGLVQASARRMLRLWAFAAKRPALYHLGERIALPLMRLWAMGRGSIRSMPFAGGWTSSRDLPTPPSRSFLDQYARTKKGGRR
jgi:L-lactate dehydrogenase complex protein LldF